jgi:putative ABC transport system permease protein
MRWLLRRFLDDADRRVVENDLAELYELRRRQTGERAAARWLKRQQMLYPLHLIADRIRATASNGLGAIAQVPRDAVQSIRSLLRTPGLSATVVLTVGIGLGATTGMMAVIQSVLINPLPYAAPDELFWIYTDNPPYRFRFSVVDYRALEADHPAFSTVAAYQTRAVTVTDGRTPDRVTARAVTGSYFPLLGQTAFIGRLFDARDDAGGDLVAVLTAPYWARRFGRDPAVLGRPMMVDGVSHTIVGVLSETAGPLERDVALFTAARWPEPRRKGPFSTMALGRLRPDVSRAAAVEALRATNARLFPLWKSSYQDEKATWGMQDLKTRVVGDAGSTILVALAAVGCVLLIACANAINLLIARGLHRSRELAIRSALGASRRHLLQQLMVESGVLTAAAAAAGVIVAVLMMRLVTTYGAGYIPRADEIRLSESTLAWLVALAGGSGLLIFAGGLVPAIHSSRRRMDSALRTGGRSTSDGPVARRLRRALVSAEFALATPLLIAAVLVIASLDRLSGVSVGIDTERVLTAAVSLSGPGYSADSDRRAFWERALARIAALPGVEAAAIADSRPPRDSGTRNNFDLEDRPTPPGRNQPICTWVGVSPAFFSTLSLPLERGRLLDEYSLRDDVVVVDRAWANRFFAGEEALGRRFRSGGCTTCPWTTVVGVVGNVKWSGLDAADDGTVYWPLVDRPNAYVVIRAAGDPAALTSALRAAIHDLDPGLALTSVATGDDLVAESLVAPRDLSVLIAMFAAAALGLSVVGVHGVMSHFVQQHSRDIGIRLALGGEPSDVRRMIVVQGLRLVIVGVAAGVGLAMLTSRVLATILFGVSPMHLPAMAGVPLVLLAVAAIACLVPGRRAAKLDPSEILREG